MRKCVVGNRSTPCVNSKKSDSTDARRLYSLTLIRAAANVKSLRLRSVKCGIDTVPSIASTSKYFELHLISSKEAV
jgi:hypothetical protein